MVIDYSKQTWVDGDTSKPLDAARLGHIESGVKAAADGVDAIVGELDGRLSEEELNATFGAGGTAGNINKPTAQGIALVQALIFGGN